MLAGVALPVWADAPATSPRPVTRGGLDRGADSEVARLIEAAKLGGAVGFCVADAATGVMLECGGADQPMAPASVCKAVTSLYALEKLGPVHRFTTRVMRVGAVVDGRLEGDLILAGGGDPTLDTDSLGDLVAALAATGLREVTGRFLAYGAAIPERERISADQPDHVGYNPAISGLMLNFNRVYFEWKRANGDWALGMDARGERFVPPVHMASARLAKREVPVFTYERGEKEDRWTVAQSALGQDGSRWLPVRHPAIYVAEVFATLCRAQGIVLKEAEVVTVLPEGAVQMVAHDSAVLTDLLRSMLKFSTNLTAEAVGLAASGAGTLEGSAAAMTVRYCGALGRSFGAGAELADHGGGYDAGDDRRKGHADRQAAGRADARSRAGGRGGQRAQGQQGAGASQERHAEFRVLPVGLYRCAGRTRAGFCDFHRRPATTRRDSDCRAGNAQRRQKRGQAVAPLAGAVDCPLGRRLSLRLHMPHPRAPFDSGGVQTIKIQLFAHLFH